MPIIIKHPPKVFLVGVSRPDQQGVNDYLLYRGEGWKHVLPHDVNAPEEINEMGGRVCYQSWNNPAGKTNQEYIQTSIIANNHVSVLEHTWANLMIADIPRSTQLELVRHGEGTAYSFESQRYTDKHLRFIMPPAIRDDFGGSSIFETTCAYVEERYAWLATALKGHFLEDEYDVGKSLRQKRGKEAARSILGNCAGSDGLFSLNATAMRHIIPMRTAEDAEASMREFMYEVYLTLKPVFPATFADAIEVPVSFGPPAIQFGGA